MLFAAIALAALMAAIPTKAIIAWSGDACNGDEGANVACDGNCIPFGGRHSFIADSPGVGGTHCVAFFVNGGCTGQMFNFTNQQGQCTNVNTGTDIESFRCFAGSGCF
ncbi:hypothetical protein AURDEDRAFT_166269 [Auricularia subglabra TFB-10046 SS5]|nr:hypothetical protein AURDEDRAFT_166269 [Auricularia subglabra TFB-10046 SS5]